MSQEIERKFLVADPAAAFAAAVESSFIAQGYLSTRKEATVRLRLRNNRAYLTIKSPNRGAVRGEWEYEIPAEDARQMLSLCQTAVISKTRHIVPYEGHTWEVDEFHGPLSPLVLAEVELAADNEPVVLPPWLGKEVTTNPAYFNSTLAASLPQDS